MTFAAFLLALIGPAAARILAAFGVSLVTLTGFVAAIATLKSSVTSSIGSLPAATIQLAGLFGFWTCLGMVFGAMSFVVTWKATTGWIGLARSP